MKTIAKRKINFIFAYIIKFMNFVIINFIIMNYFEKFNF